MSFNIEVQSGSSVRLPTKGKYCDRDIVVTATGGSGGANELKITDASYLFYNEARFDVFELLCDAITKECTDFSSIFYNCKTLTTIPQLDTSNGTAFIAMFYGCSKLTTIPQLDTSKGIKFGSMIRGCSELTTIPQLDTSNGTDFQYMFYGCSKLTTIPQLDTSNGTNFTQMFCNCYKLTTIPQLDTSNGTSFSQMFSGCQELIAIPQLDIGKATALTSVFSNCIQLTDLYLYNIRQTITIALGSNSGRLLTVDSLVHTIKELCSVTKQQTLTMGSINLEKISGLYCKIIDDTHEKKTMELCESTDEGAMTLVDYALTKNWSIT